MFVLTRVGENAISRWLYLKGLGAVAWGVLSIAARPRHWPRTVRDVFAKQVLFTGVDALGLTLLIGFLAGISIIAQAQYWLAEVGQSEMLGKLLCAVIIREIGPLLVNFVVIGRSGTAVATELAGMKVRNEVNVLEAQGIDPMTYLVMPRALGMVVSVFCLSVFFVTVALVSGYLFGLVQGVVSPDAGRYFSEVMAAAAPSDIYNFLAKTLVPPLLTASICSIEGMRVKGYVTEVPQAATRAVVKSIMALIMVSAVVSILTYA